MADSVITQYETMIWGTDKQEQKIGTQKDHNLIMQEHNYR